MEACKASGKAGCANVTTSTCDGGASSAVCTTCTLLQTSYCWVYSGPGAGREFSFASLLTTCLACPIGTMQTWN
jgi:hypothetical protein